MRITNGMITETMLNSLRGNLRRIETLHQQITTGKRINRPSDDPTAVGRAMIYRAGVDQGEQYIRNMDSALTWLNSTDDTLSSVTSLLQRSRELAVQGGSDTLTVDQQQAIGAEVDQILQQMLSLGNSSLRGQRLFGGSKIDADPFSLVSGSPDTVTYTGDAFALEREIDVGSTIAINVIGSSTFSNTFSALISLRDHLNAGNTSAISGGDIGAVDAAMDQILSVRAEVGARVNRVESARERQETLQVRLQDLLSKVEEVEFEEAVSRFAVEQTAYQAALAAGGKAIQPSLMDYLR